MKILAKTFRFDKGVLYAYVREHSVVVRTEDVWKVKRKIFDLHVSGFTIPFKDWQPQDLTEYNIEGVGMEIKEELLEPYKDKYGDLRMNDFRQIACLMADDKQ